MSEVDCVDSDIEQSTETFRRLAPYPNAIGTRPTAQKIKNTRALVEGKASLIQMAASGQ